MSLSQICADAEASIARARSLFNASATAPPTGSADLSQATTTATAASARTTELSGSAAGAYRTTTTRSTGLMHGAARGDAELAGHLTTAAAIQQAGATRLDQIAAHAAQVSKLAPFARSAAAQKAVLASMQSALNQSAQTVQSAQRQATGLSGQIRAVDFKQDPVLPKPPEPDGDKKDGDKKDGDKKDGDKKGRRGGSFGKGGEAKPEGPVENQWGTPTDPHSGDHSEGTFDNGRGRWTVEGPGRSGEAYAREHSDGYMGQADGDVWWRKGTFHEERDIFGHNVPIDGDWEVGAHYSAGGAVTDHGFSEGIDAFGGAEVHVKSREFHLGPLDLSLGGSAQFGVGGSEHLSAGSQDGKYFLGGDFGLAAGPGAKISPRISIDKSFVDNTFGKVTNWLDNLF